MNTFHVKELTGAEFDALLRSRFPNVSSALQRPVFGSVVLPADSDSAAPLCFERRGSSHFEASVGLARPQYIVAFASDGPTVALPSSVYIETGRLGAFNPEQLAAMLDAAQAEAAAERGAHVRQRQEIDVLRKRIASLEPDLEACKHELAEARGEAKGLLVANEMAERACEALRNELLSRRTAEAALVVAMTQRPPDAALQEQVQRLEAAIANIRMSHSWRVTAPLRRISRLVYRRR